MIDTAVSVTNTASPTNVTVTATVTLTSTPVAGIATSPTRAEAYVAGLTQEGASVLTVVGTSAPVGQITEIALSAFEPIGVAVNTAGTRAYVTGGLTDNIVSVVNLDTRLEIATITLHPTDAVGPYGIVVHPSQPRLYVANSNSGTISVINTANNAIVTTITLTPCPNGCAPNRTAVSPDGSLALRHRRLRRRGVGHQHHEQHDRDLGVGRPVPRGHRCASGRFQALRRECG